MLLRTADPFREFDRLTNQLLGTTNRPAVMPMDAWREGDVFAIEFDLPGCVPGVDRPRRRAQRADGPRRAGRTKRRLGDARLRAAAGVFSRQLVLGDNLDLERIEASYDAGVLRLSSPWPSGPSPARSRSAPAPPSAPRSGRDLPLPQVAGDADERVALAATEAVGVGGRPQDVARARCHGLGAVLAVREQRPDQQLEDPREGGEPQAHHVVGEPDLHSLPGAFDGPQDPRRHLLRGGHRGRWPAASARVVAREP